MTHASEARDPGPSAGAIVYDIDASGKVLGKQILETAAKS